MSKIPNGKLTIDGTDLRHENAETNESPEWQDVTDTGSAVDASNVPYREEEAICHALDIRCTAWWDSTQDPKAAPLNLNAGDRIANVRVYVGKTASYYNLPLANVKRFTMRTVVKGEVGYDVELSSHGAWSFV